MYRVTPWYRGKELIARGVQMEAWSVEDKGKLRFNVYFFNVQDGVVFNYYNGESYAEDIEEPEEPEDPADPAEPENPDISNDTGTNADDSVTPPETGVTILYLNISTGKFHRGTCRYADSMNIEQTNLTAEQLISEGYSPCQICHPEQEEYSDAA